MGFVADVLDFVRVALDGGAHISETKADPGDGDNVTAAHFGAPGDDAHPLPGDQVVLVRVPGSGTVVAVGYLDTAREGEALPGERRIYSRNSDGDIQVTFWLKADGTIILGDPDDVQKIPRDDHLQNELARLKSELDAVKADLDAHKTTFDAHIHATTATVGTGEVGVISPTTTPFPATTADPQDPGATATDRIYGT